MPQPHDTQDGAFGVYVIEFHPAGFRHAETMPEHQEQYVMVAEEQLVERLRASSFGT